MKAGAARGLPMAVASGGTRKHVMEGLTSTNLLSYFKVCSEPILTENRSAATRSCSRICELGWGGVYVRRLL